MSIDLVSVTGEWTIAGIACVAFVIVLCTVGFVGVYHVSKKGL